MSDEVFELIKKEEERQAETLMMIPSENYQSKAVREAVGSVLSNKYAEGYAGRRYYQGNKFSDEVERLALERAKKLFSVPYANVQPYSGSPANSEVMFAILEYGDTVMGMSLSSGGHLTHGQPKVTFSGKYFRSVQYSVDERDRLNYLRVERLAKKEKPKLIIAGTTAYPNILDWKAFSEIAKKVGAYFLADISHVAGLVVGGTYPSPEKYADIITTTTHKTLRGPRGAIIMVTECGLKKDGELADKVNKAVFPGMQGGPHMNTVAGIAVCLREAESASFKTYAKQVVINASALADGLVGEGLTLVCGGTESHLIVVDLRPQGLSGNVVAEALEVSGIIVNRNAVPNDLMPPFYPSGIRLGTPGVTTRGMKISEMKKIAEWIGQVVEYVKPYELPKNPDTRSVFMKGFKEKIRKDKFLLGIAEEVKGLCGRYPVK